MNINPFVGAVVGVWIVRVALNWTFYAKIVGRQYANTSPHPGMHRVVIPPYIVTDLISCISICQSRRGSGRRRQGRRDSGFDRGGSFSHYKGGRWKLENILT